MTPEVSDAQLRQCVAAGLLATSGDNIQPWRFEWDGCDLWIRLDADRAAGAYDVRGLASWTAMGAAVENISVAAASMGLGVSVEIVSPDDATPVLRLAFHRQGRPVGDPLCGALPRRCVNRRPYRREPISVGTLDRLAMAARQAGPVRVSWASARDRTPLIRLVMLGDQIMFESRPLHESLFRWLRWSHEEAARHRDGMPIDTLELGWLRSRAFRLFRSWRWVSIGNRFGFSRVAARHQAHLIRDAASIGMLTAPDSSSASMFTAGRAFERLWLQATAEGLALQPMTALLYLCLKVAWGEPGGLGVGHVRRLADAWPGLKRIFPALERECPTMLFRLGTSTPPSARSLRRPIDQVLMIRKEQP